MAENDINVTTTYNSQMDGEVQVDPDLYQPPAPPQPETVTASTTDGREAIAADEGVRLRESSLRDYREVDSGDGTRITSYESPDSSRRRIEDSFEAYQRELDRLRFPEDREFLAQQAEQEGEAPPEPTPPEAIPLDHVNAVVEQQIVLREHGARWAQAMQDPAFAEFAAQVVPNAPEVQWASEIGTCVAAQANSPALVLFLSARPEIAQQIAAMPVPRAVAEVAKISAWLQTELAAPQSAAPAPRRIQSAAPAPIRPVGGSPTKANAVDLSTCDFQTYRRVREAQARHRR